MKYAVVDIETTGLLRHRDQINYVGVGLAKDLNSPTLDQKFILNARDPQQVRRIKKILQKLIRDGVHIITQNGKFDVLFMEYVFGIRLPIHDDLMLMGTAYDMAASHSLKNMCTRYVGSPEWDLSLAEKTKPNSAKVEEYLGYDLEEPWKLYRFFRRKLTRDQIKIYKRLLKPVYLAYVDIERVGVWVDQEKMSKEREIQEKAEKASLDHLNKTYGDINWRSPQQVAKLLFTDMKLPIIKKSTKTGNPSADASSLKRLKAQGYKVAEDLLEYKDHYGQVSKFLARWPDYIQPDGRIHPSFGLTNVQTGRTSCSDPNLQQVPRLKTLRTCWTAPPGRDLIEADYSQLELRLAAHYSQDPTLLEIYRTGGDVHTRTAASMTGNPTPSKEDRTKAKPVNFGFIYGMMAKKLVSYAFDNYGVVMSLAEATRYREAYFALYPRLLTWHKDSEIACEAHGGVYNLFGRFRALPEIYSNDWGERSSAVRKGINTPVQSSGSDLLVSATAQCNKVLRREFGAWVVGTVHDSMIVDCPHEATEECCEAIQEIMESPYILREFNVELTVPLVADVAVGPWGSK